MADAKRDRASAWEPDYSLLLSDHDPNPLLKEWSGADAVFCFFTALHRVLGLMLHRPGMPKGLVVQCAEVESVKIRSKWMNANIVVEHDDRGCWVFDHAADVAIRAEAVGVKVSDKPW